MLLYDRTVSIFAGHDANITFYDRNAPKGQKFHVIELERLTGKRYFRLHVDNSDQEIFDLLTRCQNIAEEHWGISNDYDVVSHAADGWINHGVIQRVFKSKQYGVIFGHHQCHAASAFYQSPFQTARIISFDGGGNDGFFNYYVKESPRYAIRQMASIKSDFGGGYLLCGSLLEEITRTSRNPLSIPGKLMGLCAYGKAKPEWIDAFADFFVDKDYKKLAALTGLPLRNQDNPWRNPHDNIIASKQQAYDIAATAQAGFEKEFFKQFESICSPESNMPVVLTGGAALNVLLNEEFKRRYPHIPLFVSPNPNDCGLSLGHSFLINTPTLPVSICYNGIPLLDKDKLHEHVEKRGATKTTMAGIAALLRQGKIVGMVYGDSEVGPRALGNRSIVCDPSYPNMKDILNSKVKFREWYRPFAPFCKLEEANKWFDSPNFDGLEFMSFAPMVRQEFREKLPSITHVDGTSRLQTVSNTSHKQFYELLTEFGKLTDVNVLLNTSFNIRGKPILTTIEDALFVLDNTELDYVVIEDWLFGK